MLRRLRWLNGLLGRFGYQIVETHVGHWSMAGDRRVRTLIPNGYRVAGPGEWEGLGDKASELDRFIARHRREIDRR